ncbi:hypothetical protein [Thauera sp. WH-1]|uniref:hypothetical protein n=1 Tax=Thauera sp. WH-1 TaxID=3398230 RepID=UPI0039FD431F
MKSILFAALAAALSLSFGLPAHAGDDCADVSMERTLQGQWINPWMPGATGNEPASTAVLRSAACTCSTPSDAASQLSIPVRGPDGKALRLDLRSGNGWRFAGAPGVGATALDVDTEIPEALEAEHQVLVEHPLSVTVDGPTGFVFGWMHETASWEFIGRVGAPPVAAGQDARARE